MELERAALVPATETPYEKEIDLLDLMHYMLRRVKYLIVSAIIGVLVMGIYAFIIATPMYESTSQLYVVNSKDSALDLSDLQIGTYLTSDYELVFKTWEVNQQVKNNLGLNYTIDELREMVSISNPSDTRALFITVTSDDPTEATVMANEYAEVAKQYIFDTMLSEMPTTLSVALEPEKPVSPRRLFLTFMGALLCTLLCASILTVIYLLDDKIKTPEDLLKYAGAMPLTVIPVTESARIQRHRMRTPYKGRRK